MQIIITPKNRRSGLFLKKLLSRLSNVKSLEIVEDKKEIPFISLAESSLVKEWSSKDDNVWDCWAKEKLKIAD